MNASLLTAPLPGSASRPTGRSVAGATPAASVAATRPGLARLARLIVSAAPTDVSETKVGLNVHHATQSPRVNPSLDHLYGLMLLQQAVR